MKLALVLELAIVLSGVTAQAHAEPKRVRIPVASLPRQDEAVTIDPKTAVLPDGVREGSDVPKAWMRPETDLFGDQSSHCTDDRRASVAGNGRDASSTMKIWESNGKVYLDRATLELTGDKVHVVSAERTPVAYVSESIWAYRQKGAVNLVMARDFGVFSRAIFWGCWLEERMVSLPVGTVSVASSPDEVDDVLSQLVGIGDDAKRKKPPPWKGIAFRVLASVSKASADTESMLNVVIIKP